MQSPQFGWLAAGGVGLILLVVLAMISAFLNPDRRSRRTAENGGAYTDTIAWYVGGTLYDKSALDWQTAAYEDKLATCGGFLAALWQKKALKPHLQNSIKSVDDLKPYARELVICINAATRPEPNPAENRRIFGQFKVHQIAAAGIVTMGWGD